jgi:glycosyltransferase involved in cell wall biosynthesis
LKKVLIVTYHFPPRPTVGSLRPFGLAKYLPEFGWDVTILTARLPGSPAPEYKVIETPYKDALGFSKRLLRLDSEQSLMTQVAQLKKRMHIRSEKSVLDLLLKAWGEVTAYPDLQNGWKLSAIKAGHELLKREKIDAVISTSSPVTGHIVARALKTEHGIPWVADFRDLWTQNHYYPYSRFRRKIERRLELNTLREVNALVTVSGPAHSKLSALHREKTIYVITNGFDPAEVNSPCANLTSKFTITYTGNLYPGKQSVGPLFIALRDLIINEILDADDIEVRFYGAEVGWIDKQMEQYGLKEVVKQYGILQREVALKMQRESQVLLLIKWDDPNEKGAYSAKIFEYLAAKRPILAVGGYRDVVDELLEETRAGYNGSSSEEIKGIVKELYQEYKATGKVEYQGDDTEINKYDQRQMARKYADVLDSVS